MSQSTSHLKVSLTLKCVRIISWSISFFSTSIVFLMMLYVRFRRQHFWKIFLFSISYYFILECQDLVLKITYWSANRIILRDLVLKIWNSLQNIRGILLKMYYEVNLFQVDSLQSVSVLCIKKWCTQSEI